MKRFVHISIFVIALFSAMGNAYGQATTGPQPPIIHKPPVSSTHALGAALVLYVQALPRDEGTLSYQWYATNSPGADVATAQSINTASGISPTLETVAPATQGVYYYYCIVTNTNGSVVSTIRTNAVTIRVVNRSLEDELKNGDFQEYYGVYPLHGQSGGTVVTNNYMHIPVALTIDGNTSSRVRTPPFNIAQATYESRTGDNIDILPYWNTTHEGSSNTNNGANGYGGQGTGEGDAANGKVIELQDLGKTNGTHEGGTQNFPAALKGAGATGHAKGNTPAVANAATFGDGVPLVAELSAEQQSSIYQDIATIPGKIYEWSIEHGSVNANERVAVVIGPAINQLSDYNATYITDATKRYLSVAENAESRHYPIGGNNGYAYRTYQSTPNLYYHTYPYGKNNNTYFQDIVASLGANPANAVVHVANYNGQKYYVYISNATNGAWIKREGFYSVPEGTGTTVFAFVNVASNSPTTGNFLDNIIFHSGNQPVSASAMFYSGRVSLSAKTEPGYVYGIAEVRGSAVQLLQDENVSWLDSTSMATIASMQPYATGATFSDASVSNWYYYPTAAGNGTITFNNLVPSKTYRIVGIPLGAVSIASALNTNVNPSAVLDAGYYTQITIPAVWSGDGSQMATATATAQDCETAHIFLTNTDPDVEYALLDRMSDLDISNDTVVVPWHNGLGLATGAALIFEGLQTNHEYLIVARAAGYNEISYTIAAQSGVSLLTPSFVGNGCGGTVSDILRSQVTREHDPAHPGYDKIILTETNSLGEYGIYNPQNGEFYDGGLRDGNDGTLVFVNLPSDNIYHIAVREKATGSIFMVGVRVYPYADELSINYESEWVATAATDGYIDKNTTYRLQANDDNDTWIIGNDIDHEDENTWVPASGSTQLYLGIASNAGESILDAMNALGADAITMYYRLDPVEKDGWMGPSVAPESSPLIIPRRPDPPEMIPCDGGAGDYTLDYTNLPERIIVDETKTIAYSLDNGEHYTPIAARAGEDSIHLTTLGWAETPLIIPLRFPASSTQPGAHFASYPVMQPLAGRGPAPIEAMMVVISGNNTAIRGLNPTFHYQYHAPGVTTWTDVPLGTEEISGLTGYDYEIRYAPTCETPASLVQVLSVPLSIIPIDFGNVYYGYDANTIQSPLIIRNVENYIVYFDGSANKLYFVGDDDVEFNINTPADPTLSFVGAMGENTEYSISPVSGLNMGYYCDTIRLDYGSGNVAFAEIRINVVKATWENNLTAEYSNPTTNSFDVNIHPVDGESIPAGAIIQYSINPTFDREGTINSSVTHTFIDITALIETPNDLLEPATAYTVYYRYKADAAHNVSETKTLTAYTAYALDCAPEARVVEIDYLNENLKMKDGILQYDQGTGNPIYEIRVNGNVINSMPYRVSAEAENPTFTVSVSRVGPNPNIPASLPCSFTVTGREDAPTGVSKNGDNTIITLTGAFQYRVAGNTNIMANWQNATNAAGILPYGGYEVRRPGTATVGTTVGKFASKYTTIVLLSPLTPTNGILYVDSARVDGKGTTDGSSWQNATSSLAQALETARTNAAVTDIYVAVGTYKPEVAPNGGNENRDKTFTISRNLTVTGGFEYNLATNTATLMHPSNTSTILSGDLGTEGNAYHVVTVALPAGTNTATLQGVVITGGNANGNNNNVLINNRNTTRDNGGGVYFSNATTGGGGNTTTNTLKLINVVIHSNTAATNGGGLYINYSTATLVNVTVSENTAGGNGGGIYRANGNGRITNTIVYGNHDTSTTGAGNDNPEIYSAGGGNVINSNMIYYYSLVYNQDLDTPVGAQKGSLSGINFESPFVNPLEKNFRLKTNTLARDYGSTLAYESADYGAGVSINNATDVAGNLRLRLYVDLGAYEIISISGPDEICSGETGDLILNPLGMTGTYVSSDPSIAVVVNGILYSDVQTVNGVPVLDNGVPVPRDSNDPDEGKGGTITVTFTASEDGNTATTNPIVINPRIKKPSLRWTYDGICAVDESDTDEITHYINDDGDDFYIGEGGDTPPDGYYPDTSDHVNNYFANYMRWDYIVMNGISDEDDAFYDFSLYNTKDDPFQNIHWYATETGGDEITETVRAKSFWQNELHASEVYWASIVHPDSCESRRLRVEVSILDTPEELVIEDMAGYVQPSGEISFNLSNHLNVELDPSQVLEWYATGEAAQAAFDNQVGLSVDEPDNNPYDMDAPTLNLRQTIDVTYWVMRADTYGCRSLPTPFHLQLFPRPTVTMTSDDTFCPGSDVLTVVTISGGTAPYHFKIEDENGTTIKEETDYYPDEENDLVIPYSFTTSPTASTTYRLVEFSDANVESVTYSSWQIPTEGLFAQEEISMIVTEIAYINLTVGPTTGGAYTVDPDNPIDVNGTITIFGSGFIHLGIPLVTSVLFGETAATIVTMSENAIICIPPAHTSGLVTVSVVACSATIEAEQSYRYEQPLYITATLPTSYGPVTGGTEVTIEGVGFLPEGISEEDVKIFFCGVEATITSLTNYIITCVTGVSGNAMLGDIVINIGADESVFANLWTYYPVKFIKDGLWDEHHNWETQTADHILPYPGADIQIKANCLQNIDLTSDNLNDYPNVKMHSITVDPGKAYTIGEGRTLIADSCFTLRDDASFLNYGTMQAVEQNVEHLLTKGRNWYVSSPVQGATESAVVPNDRIEWYDETVPVWKLLGNSPFETGLGYTAYSAGADIAVQFSGIYNDGDQSSPLLTRTSGDKQGYNLVGNPFPSYWHWKEAAANAANLYSTIWYRTNRDGIYEFWSYNASGAVAVAPGWDDDTPSGSYSLAYVPPMQAFWVRIKDTESSGTLAFANNQRSHADHLSNVLRSGGDAAGRDGACPVSTAAEETRPMLRLRVCRDGACPVSTAGKTDETLIYADEAALNGFDDYDSDKWFNNQGVEIFTLPVSENRALTINGLSAITDGMEIPIGFQSDEGGAFSFYAKEILNLDTLDVFLRDKWLNEDFDLRSDGNYSFTSGSAPNTERFSIVFRRQDTGSVLEPGDRFLAYTDQSGHIMVTFYDKNRKEGKEKVSVFDITGRMLTEQQIVIGERTTLDHTFSEGVYLLRAGKWSAKIIVHL